MLPESALSQLGSERFVSLTTYRGSGAPVPTPMWVVRDAQGLLLSTPEGTGKLKRLRVDPRVTLTPCGRRGRVPKGARPVDGVAEIIRDDEVVDHVAALLLDKYGLEYRTFMLIERLVRRENPPRVVLSIKPA
ncbi:PPOX class F420-dependent oxidoreductase [Terrabacter sp. MAHUQ-38]|jgi:PPOX class probable F420-dependent enzyme|uniref:PPOX class F420-dependent oxidoreductase n=1 Tax=unclassified Terrabacter TaxID=2630222 RepID=UPI00165DC598|nr:PPOX class F420-dependent oxidoreductase [Terrabacter sp. MAHUQ-38]MBC9820449.1 PPOX class F420-dependent oxidoreductase [Terrabacter sp. MAHUQ-38]